MTNRTNALILDDCLSQREDGLYVDLSIFSATEFEKFVDGLFSRGERFSGLDYALFSDLLYGAEHEKSGKLRLADKIVPFEQKRRALYKAVKVDEKHAAYFFEPVLIEAEIEVPVYGGEEGNGVERRVEMQETRLDVDEFIADMWGKGVRFGIDIEAVTAAIARGASVRINIAVQRDAVEGSDAEIEEACSVLRRDVAPKQLVNGKADLRKFQNGFPHVAKDTRLLRKKASVPGKPGYKLDGEKIMPDLRRDDVDLARMAGSGTRVEVLDGCEYIVADQDGFLSLDVESNHISVTEKIENRAGVSLKTTGDISLASNEFIEHGEVQEGRVVEGRNMTFCSDVYGDIVSQGGFILLEKILSGGSAKSHGGDVTSKSKVFNSVIEACSGTVILPYAESCLILGRAVRIERAVNCDIVAENIQIGSAEGCCMAGRTVRISSSAACRDKETLISMLIPALTGLDAKIAQMQGALVEHNKVIEEINQEIAKLKSDAEFAKYLALATSIRQGKVQLNAVQQEGWQKMTARFAPSMAAGSALNTQKREQMKLVQEMQAELKPLLSERESACAGIHCEIARVSGETRVQGMIALDGIGGFLKSINIKARLREQNIKHIRIFADETGHLDWNYQAQA